MLCKPEQLNLDLQPLQRVTWHVQVGRNAKGAYKNRYTMESAAQAIRYYHGINIGYGYKKRLVKVEGGKKVVVARSFS
jgi:hypothetical protein